LEKTGVNYIAEKEKNNGIIRGMVSVYFTDMHLTAKDIAKKLDICEKDVENILHELHLSEKPKVSYESFQVALNAIEEAGKGSIEIDTIMDNIETALGYVQGKAKNNGMIEGMTRVYSTEMFLTVQQIAEKLGISENDVMATLNRLQLA